MRPRVSQPKKKKKRSASRPGGSIDRQLFSLLVGIAVGTLGFYAQRSLETKAATS